MYKKFLILSLLCSLQSIICKQSVGIIGAGAAGLASAWLLDEDYNVILLEQRERIGGHGHTIQVPINEKLVPIEIGCEFFNERMFPTLLKFLNILNIPTSSFSLGYTFFSPEQDNCLVLPPTQNNKILWRSLSLDKIIILIQLKYLLKKGEAILESKNTSITLEEFVDSLWVTNSFKDDFFFPLFAAGWGVTAQDLKKFSAYNILSWLIKNRPLGLEQSVWVEIINGVNSYTDAVCNQIKNGSMHTSVNIEEINYIDNQYIIKTNKDTLKVDHLVIATNAYEAHLIVKNIPEAEAVADTLSKFEYFRATLAVHGDERYMPKNKKDWSVANICYNGTYSALTTYKPWKNGKAFRSWIFPGFPEPKPLYALEYFYHAKQTPEYFEAQKELVKYQGKNNLWFAGIYTHDIDSHENAIVSAVKIAQNLAPKSDRLQALTSATM